MRIRLADYIADFLVQHGIVHNFTVTGGGAMHLNDALGHHPGIKSIYNHHEQACAIAAEGYARLTGKIACVCVTTGPGGTNAITGVLGGWLDSIPMFIVSGQVKKETTVWSTKVHLRQLGDQEYNIISSVAPMTKYAHMIVEPSEIRYCLEKMFYLATNGRKGPVWLDIPLDVQAAVIETEELRGFDINELGKQENPVYDKKQTRVIVQKLQEAKRPVILCGTGIRLSGAYPQFLEVVEKLNIPVVTGFNALDLMWQDHPCFCGRPATIGTRGGNFVVENSDVLLVLGCRLNIRQISYNYRDFAKNSFKIMVDIDENELKKPTINIQMPIHADVKDVINDLLQVDYQQNNNQECWLKWCRDIDAKYPAVQEHHYDNKSMVNPYAFITELSKELVPGDHIICGNGTASVVTFQALNMKPGQRWFSNSGAAAMGYGFPAALGCAVANGKKRTICIDGDGSFQMNIQELQTVVYNQLNVKIIYLNNNGYLSIRQTQTNLFKPPLVGVCDGNGISFPDMEKIADAYGIPYYKINNIDAVHTVLQQFLSCEGPSFCEVVIDWHQNFEPKLSSKRLSDGTMVSPPIDDMFPFLPREEYIRNKDVNLI